MGFFAWRIPGVPGFILNYSPTLTFVGRGDLSSGIKLVYIYLHFTRRIYIVKKGKSECPIEGG